ncbi:hypothetical protein [Frigoribacterium sp. PhB24]|uniref:hypothetical protein n=1 Tax=Frigoribacterium sp. PhB24 TaxID=2485204 RepID=UPI000F493F73|nr:hypothetical protein [Frigoribacterium sp. PhB24]ROS52941.1 hypothetical protein EDF50_1418 [Frigoribacterium sp. PhB24]
MDERKITKTEQHQRIVMTLFVTVGQETLTRAFNSPWTVPGEPTVDPNHMHRQVETTFRDLCQTWGLTKAEGLIVSHDEVRAVEYVTETTFAQKERVRNKVIYDQAAEEEARR